MENFNFLENHLCVSVGNETGAEEVPADLLLKGNPERIIGALVQQMGKHSIVAGIVCCAAFNFLRGMAMPESKNDLYEQQGGN